MGTSNRMVVFGTVIDVQVTIATSPAGKGAEKIGISYDVLNDRLTYLQLKCISCEQTVFAKRVVPANE